MLKIQNATAPLPDIDLANFNRLVALDNPPARDFEGFMRQLAGKLTAFLLDDDNPLKKYRIGFYLQDRTDSSPARISSTEYRSDPADLSGTDFIVMFNREKLSKAESEDELAFILGHELSHLGWQHGSSRLHSFSSNEETACDLSSMQMMHRAGYDVTVLHHMDADAPLTEEWRMRREARQRAISEYFDFRRPVALDVSLWQQARYEEWKPDLKMPAPSMPEEEAVAVMTENLQKIYERGGEESFRRLLKDYVQTKDGAQANKFFLRLAASAAKKFPPIDEEKRNGGFRRMQRHPVSVLGNAIPVFSSLPGNKLYPPEAVSALGRYFKENPDYYRPMKIFWDKVLPPENPVMQNNRGRE